MYLDHYGLKEAPFRITPHTDFFFSGAKRGATLEALLYAITHDEGIVKISGEVGSGKTMLCRVLMERLPDNVVIVYLANPSLAREDILYALADELGIVIDEHGRASSVMRALQQKLLALYADGKQVVVLIDEAHAMPKETLEEIRLLSNLESSRHKLLQLVLFGQPEINETLARADMRQLRERITQSFSLEPLVRDDISEYLDFRMRAAGYHGPGVFSEEAVKLIDKSSQGLTRRINILADKALLAAFAAGTHMVGAKEAKEAIRDAEFATAGSTGIPKRQTPVGLLWAMGGALAMLGLVGIWHVFQDVSPNQAKHETQLPPRPIQAAPISAPLTLPPLQVPAAVDLPKASPPPPPPVASEAQATPLLEQHLAASKPWIDSVPDNRWFLQLYTAADSKQPEQIEQFLARAQNAGADMRLLRVYLSNLAGIDRYGIIYGEYASRKEASRALSLLPAELKKHSPYPRQAIRLRPNSNKSQKN